MKMGEEALKNRQYQEELREECKNMQEQIRKLNGVIEEKEREKIDIIAR